MSKLQFLQTLFIVVALGCSIWFAKCQWDECRDMGFSGFYCVKHIG